MSLPRFTGGHIGPATAADMNRVMAAAEQVEGLRSIGRSGVTFENKRVIARLDTLAATAPEWEPGYERWTWKQVVATHPEPGMPWSFIDMPGGLHSGMFGPGNDAYAIPLSGGSSGQIVELFRIPTQQGTAPPLGGVWYMAVPLMGAASGAVGVVKSVTEAGNPLTLGYPGYTVGLVVDAATDMFTGSGAIVPAINTFELAGQLQQDVQTQSPGTKTLIRLKTGDPVGPLVKLKSNAGQLWAFCMPNAYNIVCGSGPGPLP